MANRKITELNKILTSLDEDLLIIEQTNGTKAITKSNLLKEVNLELEDKVNFTIDNTNNLEIPLVDEKLDIVNNNYKNISSQLDSKANKDDVAKISSGTPLFASSTTEMTDITKNYVNTTDGYLYIYSEGNWVKTNVQYQSTGIDKKSIYYKHMNVPYPKGVLGKNLFDKNNIETNKAINSTSGVAVASVGNSISDYIELEYNNDYVIKDSWVNPYALYDKDKVFVKGYAGGYEKTFNTSDNIKYIRATINNANLSTFQIEKGKTSTSYEEFKYYLDSDAISNDNKNIIKDYVLNDINGLYLKGVKGKNLFNKNDININTCVNATNGSVFTNNLTSTNNYIEVEAETYYTLKQNNVYYFPRAFYNANKEFISAYSGGYDKTFKTPVNTKYVILTVLTEDLDIIQLEKGTQSTDYEEYGLIKLDNSNISDDNISLIAKKLNIKSNEIHVDINGNKDFTSLRSALESIIEPSIANKYTVYLYPGTYNLTDDYTTDEIKNESFLGYEQLDYVDIIGVGDKNKIIINCELPNDIGSSTITRVSTLNIKGTGSLRNVTVIGKNCRYAVHDDFGWNYSTLLREVIDCNFKKLNGLGYVSAYGSGVYNGNTHIFDNCYFYSEQGNAYSVHNNVNFTIPSKIKLINCEFDTTTSAQGARFGYLVSNTKDEIHLIGCDSKNGIQIMNEDSSSVDIKFKIKGYGNAQFNFIKPESYNIANTNGFIKTT